MIILGQQFLTLAWQFLERKAVTIATICVVVDITLVLGLALWGLSASGVHF